jgi:hypothetical protein
LVRHISLLVFLHEDPPLGTFMLWELLDHLTTLVKDDNPIFLCTKLLEEEEEEEEEEVCSPHVVAMANVGTICGVTCAMTLQ